MLGYVRRVFDNAEDVAQKVDSLAPSAGPDAKAILLAGILIAAELGNVASSDDSSKVAEAIESLARNLPS